jgi:hypothetical protein
MKISDNYILILSHIYQRRVDSLSKNGAQQTLADQLPTTYDYHFILFLIEHGAKNNDITNWITANETVLNQLKNVKWRSKNSDLLIGYYGGDDYYVYWSGYSESKIIIPIASLVGSGNIKPLLVYKYIEEERTPSQAHSKIIGHFGFLVPFVQKFTLVQDYDRLRRMTEDFVYANWGALHRIRSQFKNEPRELGRGEDGIAYSIGPERVLKLFTSHNAYKAAVNAIQRLWNQPESAGTEAMIYDAGAFKPFQDDFGATTTYYYIIEKMTPSREVINQDILESLITYIKRYAKQVILKTEWYKFDIDPSIGPKIAPEIRQASEIIDEGIRKNYTGLMLIKRIEEQAKSKHLKSNWLARLAEEIIWKLITKRTDLHSGNLGITPHGEFRYFDPTFSE